MWTLAIACRKLSLRRGEAATASSSGIPPALEHREWALAQLATRLPLLSLSEADPEGLVSSRLSTLLAVSRRWSGKILAKCIPEPMLGAAAFVEMGCGRHPEDALEALVSLLDAGGASSILATGNAGDFVASALLFAYDAVEMETIQATRLPSATCTPVSASAFLKALLGPSVISQEVEARCGILLGAFVGPLQRIVVEGEVCPELLIEALKRDFGIICERGEFATDIVLPMVLPGKRDKATRKLTTKDMTGMFIQVKSWPRSDLSRGRIEEALLKMDRFADGIVPGIPYTSLVMSVAEDAVGSNDKDFCRYDGRKVQLLLSGIDPSRSRGLAERMASSPRAMLTTGFRQVAQQDRATTESRAAAKSRAIILQMKRRILQRPHSQPESCSKEPAHTLS